MVVASGTLLGLGLYSCSEAARYLRVDSAKLRRWAKGYTFRSTHGARRSPAVITRQLPDLAEGQYALTFLDFIELKFVAAFREAGVSMTVIRAAAGNAARFFDTTHPFAVRKFATDGQRIFAQLQPHDTRERIAPSTLTSEIAISQMVFDRMVEPSFNRELDFDQDIASAYWPRGRDQHIVMTPNRCFGKPIDDETGVPTRALYEQSHSGETLQAIADWYDIPVEAAQRAVEFEQSLDMV